MYLTGYKTSFTSIVLVISICAVWMPAYAQNIKLPNVDGKCEPNYMPFRGVCISREALNTKGAEVIVQEFMEFRTKNQNHVVGITGAVCETRIADDNGDILKLTNGSIVEISFGFLGFVGFNKRALLFQTGGVGKLWVEGKKIFNVEVLRPSSSCRVPYITTIELAHNDQTFIIDDEVYKAQGICSGWLPGQRVTFAAGNTPGMCVNATLLNIDTFETCDVWCK